MRPPIRPAVPPSANPNVARTPAVAEVDAVLNSGHLAASRPFLWMRRSKSFSLVPSARQTTARSAKPATTRTPAAAAVMIVVACGHPSFFRWPC